MAGALWDSRIAQWVDHRGIVGGARHSQYTKKICGALQGHRFKCYSNIFCYNLEHCVI